MAAALASVALLCPSVQAATFTGTGNSVNGVVTGAQADFSISGNQLTVVLSNIGTGSINASADVLSGLFFDVNGSTPTFTPVSALVTSGSSVVQFGSNPSNVGGEWRYQSFSSVGSGTGQAPARYGISSSGYDDLFGVANFNGPDLQPPPAVDGIQFGLVNPSFVAFQGNGGLDSNALIRNSVTFTLTFTGSLSESQLANAYFWYGTSQNENRPNGGQIFDPVPDNVIPEPSTTAGVVVLGGLFASFARRRRSRTL
jgi:hypothetical protein